MAQSRWTGKLYLFRDDEGEHVSLAPPTSKGNVQIRAYVVRGPFIPIGFQKSITLPDASKWLDDLLSQGFSCQPCSSEFPTSALQRP